MQVEFYYGNMKGGGRKTKGEGPFERLYREPGVRAGVSRREALIERALRAVRLHKARRGDG